MKIEWVTNAKHLKLNFHSHSLPLLGKSDAQATITPSQRSRCLLQWKRHSIRGDTKTVQHQKSQLYQQFLARAIVVKVRPGKKKQVKSEKKQSFKILYRHTKMCKKNARPSWTSFNKTWLYIKIEQKNTKIILNVFKKKSATLQWKLSLIIDYIL